jgi:hypothetical protein
MLNRYIESVIEIMQVLYTEPFIKIFNHENLYPQDEFYCNKKFMLHVY